MTTSPPGVATVTEDEAVNRVLDVLDERRTTKTAQVGVIGLGYVGLPLAVEFAGTGFLVTGLDIAGEGVAQVNAGRSYIPDVAEATLGRLVRTGRLTATCGYDALAWLDVVIICVPTPLRKTREPDISYTVLRTPPPS